MFLVTNQHSRISLTLTLTVHSTQTHSLSFTVDLRNVLDILELDMYVILIKNMFLVTNQHSGIPLTLTLTLTVHSHSLTVHSTQTHLLSFNVDLRNVLDILELDMYVILIKNMFLVTNQQGKHHLTFTLRTHSSHTQLTLKSLDHSTHTH
jgi:hypothetical protein